MRVLWEGCQGSDHAPTRAAHQKHAREKKHYFWFLHTVEKKIQGGWNVHRVAAHSFAKALSTAMPRIGPSSVRLRSPSHLLEAIVGLERDVPAVFADFAKYAKFSTKDDAKAEVLQQTYVSEPVKVGLYLPNIQLYAMRILECYRQRIQSPDFVTMIEGMQDWQIVNAFYLPLCTDMDFEAKPLGALACTVFQNPFIDQRTMDVLREKCNFLEYRVGRDTLAFPNVGQSISVRLPDGFERGSAPAGSGQTIPEP